MVDTKKFAKFNEIKTADRAKQTNYDSYEDFDNEDMECDFNPPSDFKYVVEKKKNAKEVKDFNYRTSVVNAKKAVQKVNSIYIGTAIKQMAQKEAEAKIASNSKKAMAGGDFTYGFNISSLNPFKKNKYLTMDDYSVGIDYLNKFHEANKTSAKAYVDNLFATQSYAKAKAGIEALGMAIKSTDMSESDVQDSADELASLSSGKIPATIGAFLYALQQNATATPFVDAIVDNTIVKGFQKVGDTIISAGESVVESVDFASKVNKLLPFILPAVIGYGIYFIYFKKKV